VLLQGPAAPPADFQNPTLSAAPAANAADGGALVVSTQVAAAEAVGVDPAAAAAVPSVLLQMHWWAFACFVQLQVRSALLQVCILSCLQQVHVAAASAATATAAATAAAATRLIGAPPNSQICQTG
jgi:hypothetical protein